jgi:sulfite exporter TauE/SafE
MEAMLLTAVTVGILGGVHCVAMCGGVVGALTLRRVVHMPGRAPGIAAQLLFNGGRVTSYVAAGALAGSLGGAGIAAGTLIPAQMMLFVLANGLLILLGLHLAGAGSTVLALESAGAKLAGVARTAAAALGATLPPAGTPAGRFAAGLAWGWTPCGLVYSMLALALVSGSALRGGAVMLAFGIGTLPNLLAAGWLLARFGDRLRRRETRIAAGILIAAFGVVGLVRAPGLAAHLREGLLCMGLPLS